MGSILAVLSLPVSGDQPTKAQPQDAYLQSVIVGMKLGPAPANLTTQAVRIMGNVKAVGPDGVLLQNAAVVHWAKSTSAVAGKITDAWIPGGAYRTERKMVYVYGATGALGQKLTVDALPGKTKDLVVDKQSFAAPGFTVLGARSGARPLPSKVK